MSARVGAVAFAAVLFVGALVLFVFALNVAPDPAKASWCRDGEVVVYNLREHRDVFGVWVPDDESGTVPVVWCDSSGLPSSMTVDELDGYGISLEAP